MKKLNDKKQVVAQISAAARLYKKNLVGKHFLYVFDGRAIEVAYQAKGFRHLTGVDTGLDAMSFYKKAVSGTLQANQIFFSPHHPYQLCQRKPGLHIPAHGVQQYQQALDPGVLLHGGQLGDHMLILGGLLPLRRFRVPLDLADDGQAVDGMAAPGQGDRTVVLDAFFFQPLLVHRGGVCIRHSVFSFCSVLHHHAPSNRRLSLCGRVIPLNFL